MEWWKRRVKVKWRGEEDDINTERVQKCSRREKKSTKDSRGKEKGRGRAERGTGRLAQERDTQSLWQIPPPRGGRLRRDACERPSIVVKSALSREAKLEGGGVACPVPLDIRFGAVLKYNGVGLDTYKCSARMKKTSPATAARGEMKRECERRVTGRRKKGDGEQKEGWEYCAACPSPVGRS
ncbi:hypothetical protein FA13DRAFT_1709091 [Coprinellus micaceus]|uniref:Uncharacterized protein n=1 Tax=Coprinellus micaceus TaxID=71717 RepID=A0A4Y7TF23_COPMI|nr:hypothetical protein FA13DRAFT_1709091 [Coprinellus micaceus]